MRPGRHAQMLPPAVFLPHFEPSPNHEMNQQGHDQGHEQPFLIGTAEAQGTWSGINHESILCPTRASPATLHYNLPDAPHFPTCGLAAFCFHRAMPSVALAAIVKYCDQTLRTREVNDYDKAVNGLQMQNSGKVTKIAATVDASLATIQLAIAAKTDLLMVHHGLFWGSRQPWTGKNHELIRLLVENDLAVYSSHL